MSISTKIERVMCRVLRIPTCEELEAFAYDFLEGKLDPVLEKKVERHLKICVPCQKFMAAYRRARALGSEELPPLDPAFKGELLQFLIKKNS
ncbi:MAG: zf-HC2 domain-containing protein [bacterium]